TLGIIYFHHRDQETSTKA
ncbi:hypothetical protein SOVF_200810, partial [Spinacia oleracea]